MKTYKVVYSLYLDSLEEEVNQEISDGYRLQGGVCAGYSGDGCCCFYQAMVWGGAEK